MIMKKLYVILLLALLPLAAMAQDGKSIYRKYSDSKDVSAVYISSAMFRMMGKLPDMQISKEDKVNLSPIVKTLQGLYVLDSSNADVNAAMAKDVETFVKRGKYELMMEVKDSGETVHIYTCGDESVINGLVLTNISDNTCTFICLDGTIPRQQLEQALAQ